MKCPKCGFKEVMSTLMGMMVLRKPVPDTANTATCHVCNYSALASEFGAIVQPLRGTEDWTEEQASQWLKDFAEGKISIHEEIGMAVYNPRGLSRIFIE